MEFGTQGNLSPLSFSAWSLSPGMTYFAAVLLLLFTIIIFFIVTGKNRKSRNKGLNLPPGSYGWPILGESIEFIRTRNDGCSRKFLQERREKYKSEVFRISILGESMAVLCGPAGNKFLFSNENKLVTVWWPASVKMLLGNCISTSPGADGMLMRKMASYFFTPDALAKLYIKTMDLVSQQHLNTHWQGSRCKKIFI